MDRYKALTVLAVVADAGSMRRAARVLLVMPPRGASGREGEMRRRRDPEARFAPAATEEEALVSALSAS